MACKKIWAGIAAMVCAANVQADPISMVSTVFSVDHINTGGGKSYQINVNDLLDGWGIHSNAITAGQLTLFASSAAVYSLDSITIDSLDKTDSKWRNKPGACNNGRCQVEDATWLEYNTKNYKDVSDTMWLKVGAAVGSDTTADDQQQSYTPYGNKTLTDISGSQRDGWNTYYARSRTFYQSYSGDMSITLDLDNLALFDLVQDGILDLDVWSSAGQFDINSFTLRLDAEEPGAPAAVVPLPTSLLLTGLGLAALGAMRRRSRI